MIDFGYRLLQSGKKTPTRRKGRSNLVWPNIDVSAFFLPFFIFHFACSADSGIFVADAQISGHRRSAFSTDRSPPTRSPGVDRLLLNSTYLWERLRIQTAFQSSLESRDTYTKGDTDVLSHTT